MSYSLKDQTVIVTGSSRGLGSSIAKTMAKNGANVLICYHERDDLAKEVTELIERDFNVKAVMTQVDVTNSNSVKEMFDVAIEEFGSIDIIINNAGITGPQKLLEEINDEEWKKTIQTNLSGPFFVIKEVIPYMKKRHYGRIINIGSITGLIGDIGIGDYCAAKSGLIGLTKTAAKELGKYGITVNLICPGYTDLGQMIKVPEKIVEKKKQTIAVGRVGTAQEIADVILFFVSKEASYVTAQVVNVNGGAY